jgi:uncharacterized membrane protein
MSDRPADEKLADSLLAEEARSRGGNVESDTLLRKVVDHELAAERRVRRAAIAAWAVLLTLLVLFAVTLVTGPGSGVWRWVAIGIYYGVPVLAGLTLIIAILTTTAWLFRPRGASLAAIERRLAALEDLIRRAG